MGSVQRSFLYENKFILLIYSSTLIKRPPLGKWIVSALREVALKEKGLWDFVYSPSNRRGRLRIGGRFSIQFFNLEQNLTTFA